MEDTAGPGAEGGTTRQHLDHRNYRQRNTAVITGNLISDTSLRITEHVALQKDRRQRYLRAVAENDRRSSGFPQLHSMPLKYGSLLLHPIRRG